jgi:cytochrome c oxidase assembly protein subunit 15
MTVVISYLQLVIGAHLRHISPNWSPQVFRAVVLGHLLVAALLSFQVLFVSLSAWRSPCIRRQRLVFFPANSLLILVLLQLLLGAATWRVKYFWPTWLPQPASWRGAIVQAEGMLQAMTVTAHVAIGALILGMAVLCAMRTTRLVTQTTTIRATASAAKLREVVA